MPFAACQSDSSPATAPSISSCLFFVRSVLLLFYPFLDLLGFSAGSGGGLWGQSYATLGLFHRTN